MITGKLLSKTDRDPINVVLFSFAAVSYYNTVDRGNAGNYACVSGCNFGKWFTINQIK
jgi:hypothetical protein